jgi:hypothetical protein
MSPCNFFHGAEHGRFAGLALGAMAKVIFPYFLGPPKRCFFLNVFSSIL